jgi:hypothetical protein
MSDREESSQSAEQHVKAIRRANRKQRQLVIRMVTDVNTLGCMLIDIQDCTLT